MSPPQSAGRHPRVRPRRRGRILLWVLLILGLALAVPVVAFIIDPPFSVETGHLTAHHERDVDLADGATGSLRLDLSTSPGIWSTYLPEAFPPIEVSARVVDASGAEGTGARLRLYPIDATLPPLRLELDDAKGRIAWQIACGDVGPTCAQSYQVVAVGAAPGAKVRVAVDAELDYPLYVEAPAFAGIDLRSTQLDVAGAFTATELSGSARLSADGPIATQELALSTGGVTATAGGGLITASAVRVDGEARPTGFEAPPAVRVAVTDEDGRLLADLGVRPGTTTASSLRLPAACAMPCETAWRVVVLWQDLADQAYEVEWRIEAGAVLPSGALEVAARRVASEPAPASSREVTGDGTVGLGGALFPEQDLASPLAVTEGRLPDALTVLHVELTLRDTVGEPVRDAYQLVAEFPDERRTELRQVLLPGETATMALAVPPCPNRCGLTAFRIIDPVQPDLQAGGVDVTWAVRIARWEVPS